MSKLALPIAGAVAVGVAIAVGIVFWESPEEERPALPQTTSEAKGTGKQTTDKAAALPKPTAPEGNVSDKAPSVSEPLPEVTQVEVPPVSEARVPENPLRPKLDGANSNPRAGSIARSLIADIRSGKTPFDPEKLHARAQKMRTEGQIVDAHLLDFFSAREGYGPAAYSLALAYDPVEHNSAASVMDDPDAAQAAKWYRKALEGGVSEAEAKLTGLHSWLEQAVRSEENAELSLLLQQWK